MPPDTPRKPPAAYMPMRLAWRCESERGGKQVTRRRGPSPGRRARARHANFMMACEEMTVLTVTCCSVSQTW